jgi:type VI protein secretion system component VasK
VTSRTDVYMTAVLAAIILIIGLTILVTGVFTTSKVGAVIIAGTALTTVGALASLVTGYRAAHHYATDKTDRAAAALAHAIAAHDAALDARPPEAASKVVPFGEAQARRQPRESAT